MNELLVHSELIETYVERWRGDNINDVLFVAAPTHYTVGRAPTVLPYPLPVSQSWIKEANDTRGLHLASTREDLMSMIVMPRERERGSILLIKNLWRGKVLILWSFLRQSYPPQSMLHLESSVSITSPCGWLLYWLPSSSTPACIHCHSIWVGTKYVEE